MTKAEILKIIDSNIGKKLYASMIVGAADNNIGADVGFFVPVSKTNILKAWKSVVKAETGTYNSFRPDLRGKITNGEQLIVVFRLERV